MCDEISLLTGSDRALEKKSILRGPVSIPFAEQRRDLKQTAEFWWRYFRSADRSPHDGQAYYFLPEQPATSSTCRNGLFGSCMTALTPREDSREATLSISERAKLYLYNLSL